MKKLLLLTSLVFSSYALLSQDCRCTVSDVLNNGVEPCSITKGSVVVVETTSELLSAFRTANNSGGNMTILIEDGIYPVASTASYPYLTANDLVIRSRSGNRDAVVLTGQGMRSVNPATENGLSIQGDNVVIADLTIRDVGNHGIATTGDSLLIHNVRIQDTYEQMIKGNQASGGAQAGIVQCCRLEYTQGIGPNWYIGGLDIHRGTNWLVRDNVFFDIESPVQSPAEHAVHFWTGSANNVVERNVIVGCDRGIGFGLGSSPNSGGIIQNNMIVNNGDGRFDDVGIGLETSPGTKVLNNSILIAYPNAIEYRFQETVDVEIVNNLTNRTIRSRNGGSGRIESNETSAEIDWFIDAEAGNLRLRDRQPTVVDQGEDVSVLVDIDQEPRPQGGGFDIGASEFPISTGVGDAKERIWIDVYPNPTSDKITLWILGTKKISEIEIFNDKGQLHWESAESSLLPQSVNVSNWSHGVYHIRASFLDGEEKSRIFIVQ